MKKSVSDVVVVDDDVSIRESLEAVLSNAGFSVRTFKSAEEFLGCIETNCPSCAVLEVSLPGLGGLQLQEILSQRHPSMPIIFITGYCDIPTSVQAMKRGAAEFLTKPLHDEVLLQAVGCAVAIGKRLQSAETEMRTLTARYGRLTPRERAILPRVISGLANKNVGFELGISEITVKAHRGSIMRKLKAESLASLIQMAMKLRLMPECSESRTT